MSFLKQKKMCTILRETVDMNPNIYNIIQVLLDTCLDCFSRRVIQGFTHLNTDMSSSVTEALVLLT